MEKNNRELGLDLELYNANNSTSSDRIESLYNTSLTNIMDGSRLDLSRMSTEPVNYTSETTKRLKTALKHLETIKISYIDGDVPIQNINSFSSYFFDLVSNLESDAYKTKIVSRTVMLQVVDWVIEIFKVVFEDVYSDVVSKRFLIEFENELIKKLDVDFP